GGPFSLKPGEWTDDTSMALCLAVSLIEKRGFDAKDQMDRYCRWRDQGYLSSNGRCYILWCRTNSAGMENETGHARLGGSSCQRYLPRSRTHSGSRDIIV